MDTPEWDFFKRIENLELRTKGKLTLADASMLGCLSFELAFIAEVSHFPQNARKYKDILIGRLRQWGFNKELLDGIETDLLKMCDEVDKAK